MLLHGFLPSLIEGAAVTLGVALSSLVVAAALGLAGALAKLSRSRIAQGLAGIYTTLIRGVPDLVLMLLVFYGGQVAVNTIAPLLGHEDYIDIDPFVAGVLTIGFIFGAYLTEAFRGAFLAVPPGQREAGLAFGMSPRQVLWACPTTGWC
jgi:arginine/ornithine transport system permease protein